MGNVYKVVVTGPFNAGKTEFIRTISSIPVVSTERRISDDFSSVKDETTVALDYGQVRLGKDLFHLYGTPGQPRFDFMRDILSREMHAFVVLVDSCDRGTFSQARRLIHAFRRKGRVPYLVVANKQDGDGSLSPSAVAKALKLDGKAAVVPCVASKKASARNVLKELKILIG